MKKHIPNALTSGNVLCGCIAITEIASGNFLLASILVVIASIFDFFDGFAARLLKVGSPLGAELDSMADMVSFGLVPAYLAHELISPYFEGWISYIPFLMAIFSAIRLAKFNLDTRQSNSFIGLPTPANALFWISIPLIKWQAENEIGIIKIEIINSTLNNGWLLLIFSVIFSLLLVAELPLLALKFKSFNWVDNKYRWTLIGISLILFSTLFAAAIPFILISYILLSIIENFYKHHYEIQS